MTGGQRVARTFFHSANDECAGSQGREEHGGARTTDDRALGSELGQESGRDTTGRQDDDGTCALFDGSGNSSHGQSLGSLGRSGGKLSELVKEGLVGERLFGEECSLGHHLD